MSYVHDVSVLGGPPLWMKFANCRNRDTQMFFLKKGQRPTEGVEICHECPVMRECKDYADANDIQHGIWGGENRTPANTRSQGEDH